MRLQVDGSDLRMREAVAGGGPTTPSIPTPNAQLCLHARYRTRRPRPPPPTTPHARSLDRPALAWLGRRFRGGEGGELAENRKSFCGKNPVDSREKSG